MLLVVTFVAGGPGMSPPGIWTPGHQAHFSHQDHRRSRSPRRASLEDLGSTLSALRPSDFRMIFSKLPSAVRAVAFEAPDDVNTDIKSIMDKDEQKESMNSAERGFVLLPPPNLPHFTTKTVLKLSQCEGQWKGISGTSSTKSQ